MCALFFFLNFQLLLFFGALLDIDATERQIGDSGWLINIAEFIAEHKKFDMRRSFFVIKVNICI